MMRPVQRPTIEEAKSPTHETVERHPAYGQIQANRVSGRACLYGSDFEHQNYISITIRGSVLHRGLSRDWPFARNELISVDLSEAQWATFVSAMNSGMGVQCTIDHIGGEQMPGIPEPTKRQEQFAREARETLADGLAALEKAKVELVNARMSQVERKKVMDAVDTAIRELVPNLKFVADQFGEHVENTTEAAKQEIHGYIQNVVNRTGIAALQGASPILLEMKDVSTDTDSE